MAAVCYADDVALLDPSHRALRIIFDICMYALNFDQLPFFNL